MMNPDALIGHVFDNYRLVRRLGRGAFGVVFEAETLFDGKVIGRTAVKLIEPQSDGHRASIINELAALANCSHPNIVSYRTHSLVDIDGVKHVLVGLEYSDVGTLTDAYRSRALTSHEILDMARDVASGLEFLATRGVLHRDLKPDNILGFSHARGMTWKISDFGLARPVSTDGKTTGAAGTMLYLAPEAWEGSASPASDIWALGLCVHEAVTQHRLWAEVADGALQHVICNAPAPIENDLPLALKPLVEGCLQHDAAKRWSAAQVLRYVKAELEKTEGAPQRDIIVSQGGGGTHGSIGDAVRDAKENQTIYVAPGHYLESLVIGKSVKLIGFDPAGREPRDKVVLRCGSGNVLKIGDGVKVLLQNLSLRGEAGAQGKKFFAVSVHNAHVGFKNCILSSDSLPTLLAGSGARVGLVETSVEKSTGDGLAALDGGQIIVRASKIEHCGRHGIALKSGAKLEAHHSTIEGCRQSAVNIGENCNAAIQNCRLQNNGMGVQLERDASAQIGSTQITHNSKSGVCAVSGSHAVIENCDAKSNGQGAWAIASGAIVNRTGNTPP